jgi:hypothetical protein
MADTVKLPGIGQVKKGYVIAGGVVVVVIVGYAYYRHSQDASTTATDPSTTAADTNIDPATGYPYGSAEDEAALAAQAGQGVNTDNGIDPLTGFAYGSVEDQEALAAMNGGAYSVGTGGVVSTGTTGTSTSGTTGSSTAANTGPGTFTSNAAWLDWITANNSTGYSTNQIVTACSIWLYGGSAGTLTTTDVSVILACEAIAGQPPSYPGAPQASGSGSGQGSTPPPSAGTKPGATSLHSVTKITSSSATASWTKATGATSYEWQINDKGGRSGDITATSFNFTGLDAHTRFTFTITPKNSAGDGPVAHGSFTTAKAK